MANLNGVHWSLAERIIWAVEQSRTRASKPFWITTGFRSNAEQTRFWNAMNDAIRIYGEPTWRKYAVLAAKPGASLHQFEEPKGTPNARAVDIACLKRDNPVRVQILWEAGLCTPVAGEPWHAQERSGIPMPASWKKDEGDDMPLSKYIIEPCSLGGYWKLKRSDGGVANDGGAPFFGAMPAIDPGKSAKVVAPLVGLTECKRDGEVIGYWIHDEDGHVYSYGKAPHYDGYAEHKDWQSPNRTIIGLVQTAGWGKGQQIRYAQIGEEVGDADYVVDTYDLGPEFNKK